MPDTTLRPLRPLRISDRFPVLGRELLGLLRSLDPAAWEKRTDCPKWRVRDIVAHLLDTACRRLSFERDGLPLLEPDREIASDRDLVAWLDDLNATWVDASRRLSPRLMIEILSLVEDRLATHVAQVDPGGAATFAVSWAGEDSSLAWFDLARELTERWIHQQQIRRAVGAAPLDDPWMSVPVLETFLRALLHRYRNVGARIPGTALALRIVGRESYRFALVVDARGAWTLWSGEPSDGVSARIEIDEESTWRLVTKGLAGSTARERARTSGPEELVAPFFDTVAVMA